MDEAPQSDMITFDEFRKVKLRVAKIIEATDHPDADKLLVLQIDLGDEQRQLCAGLKGIYTPEQLVGRNIIVVANLAPRTLRGVQSQGMLLAAGTEDQSIFVTLTTAEDIPPGSYVS